MRSFHSGRTPEDLGSTDCEEVSLDEKESNCHSYDLTPMVKSRLLYRHAGYSCESNSEYRRIYETSL